MVVLRKLWAEVALMSLLGQWVLGLLVGAQREGNLAYQLLGVVGLPFVWLMSRLGERWIPTHRRRLWAAALLLLLWLVGTAGKIWACLGQGGGLLLKSPPFANLQPAAVASPFLRYAHRRLQEPSRAFTLETWT